MRNKAKILILLLFCILPQAFSKPREKDKGKETENTQAKSKGREEKSRKDAKPQVQKVLRVDGGIISLAIMQQKGVWRLYAVDKNGDKNAVLSDYDEGAGSGFFVKAGRAEYKLNAFGGVEVSARASADSALLEYGVGAAAKVSVLMSFVKSVEDADSDILKIKVSITNKKKRSEVFALKGVFDTVLEERNTGGFSTAALAKVTQEAQFLNMEEDRWIVSSDDKMAVQFLLYGADITPPKVVTLANSEIIALPLWTPVISAMRSFDNVMMYNNSSVCINWPEVKLQAGESCNVVFYIALGIDGNKPNGEAFIDNFGQVPVPSKEPAVVVPFVPAQPSGEEAEQDTAGGKGTDEDSEPPVPSGPKREVIFDAVPDEKIDPEYLRSLIERINALENDGSNTNVEELLELNTELDRALDILKKKR